MLKLGGVVGGVVGGNASAEGGLDRWRSGEVRLDGMAVSGDLGAASASVRLRQDNRQRMVELAIRNVVRIGRTEMGEMGSEWERRSVARGAGGVCARS